MNKWKIATLVLLQIPWPSVAGNVKTEKSKTKDWLVDFIPSNYERTYPPAYKGTFDDMKNKTDVKWNIIPHVISSISVKHMDFSVEMLMTVNWDDSRLVTPEAKSGTLANYQPLPKDVAVKLWHPIMEFVNCKQCAMEVIDPSTHHFELNNRKISVQYRQTFSFTCEFDLTHYPFDVQTCTIDLGLYEPDKWSGLIKLLMFVEFPKARRGNADLSTINVPAEFQLISFNVERPNCKSKNKTRIITDACFKIKLTLARSRVQHILLTFIPSMLIVSLSWISFWLEPNIPAPRVALGLTSLLTLSTQFNTSQKDLPSVATFKALDVWMFTCICMVFASLIEFGVSHNFYRLKKMKESKIYAFRNDRAPKKMRRCCGRWIVPTFSKREIINLSSEKIDGSAKIIFPAIFITFNVVFWLYYSSN